MSSPACQLETVFPVVDGPAAPRRAHQALLLRHTIRGRAAATLTALAIVSTLGGSGVPLASANAQHLQSRATDLHARWGQMIADGVPSSDLAALQSEWTAATGAPDLWRGQPVLAARRQVDRRPLGDAERHHLGAQPTACSRWSRGF